jgi:biotin carboxylase
VTRTVLVVGAGPYQVDAIVAARDLGCRVAAVDMNPQAPGLALADAPHVVNLVDVPGVVAVARQERVQAVLTAASDVALNAVVAVAEALSLPGLSPAVLGLCRHKARCADALLAAGLPAPAADPEGFPRVVKPVTAAGGRGVTVVRRPAELAAAVAKARAYGAVLQQRFIDGRAVGCEAFFYDGALAAAFLMDDPLMPPAEGDFPSPVGHSLPCDLPAAEQVEIHAQVQAFGAALGLDGPANFDLRWDGATATLLEVNPRLGGSSISALVRAAHGVELPKAAVLFALGASPAAALAPTRATQAASRLILAKGRGPVHGAVAAAASWRDHPQVRALDLFACEGAPCPLTVDDWSLLGSVVTAGPGADAVAARVARAVQDATGVAR